jgi:hypothetical protein
LLVRLVEFFVVEPCLDERLRPGLAAARLRDLHSGKALLGDDEFVAQLVVNDCGFPSEAA